MNYAHVQAFEHYSLNTQAELIITILNHTIPYPEFTYPFFCALEIEEVPDYSLNSTHVWLSRRRPVEPHIGILLMERDKQCECQYK